MSTKRWGPMVGAALAIWLVGGAACGQAEGVSGIRVVCDRAPDCSSPASIVETVTRGCETDDARAIALYNFCRYAYYHHAYPSEPGGISALKLINVYGWSLCGGEHTVYAALCEQLGWPWRYRGWSNPGHTTVEVFYGGRWHYLDTFLKFYTWTRDETGAWTVASQDDIKADPTLVLDALVPDGARNVWYHRGNEFDWVGDEANWQAPAFLVCGDSREGVVSGVESSSLSGSPRGWNAIKFDDEGYSMAVDLGVGYALTLNWDRVEGGKFPRDVDPEPEHSCGDKDYRNCPAIGPLLEPYAPVRRARSWSNGELLFRPDLGTDTWLGSAERAENVTVADGQLRPTNNATGELVIRMQSPYLTVWGEGRIASVRPDDGLTVEVSTDGEQWTRVEADGRWDEVGGSYDWRARIRFTQPITGLEVESIVQHNQEALPYLAPGRNTISLSAQKADLADARLAVTYAYEPGWRSRTYGELLDGDCEVARAHYAAWAQEPVVVQTIVDRLPAQIVIDVPTPEGAQPVYPRMLFLRREVLAPGQEPLATPAEPSQQRLDGVELPTLPNPWTIGTQPPREPDRRPTRTISLPCPTHFVVSMDGQVFEHQFVKWLKDDSNAWVWLLQLPEGLPEAAGIAAAEVVFEVAQCHDQADMQVAATALQAPVEPGRPYDFAKLGPPIGSTIVKRATGPTPFEPPREYAIDVTRGLRRMLRTGKPYGFAIRIVPNRAVDDGWTVRFTPAQERTPQLVLQVWDDTGQGGKP